MSKYDINIAKLAIQLLPMCLRGNKTKAFVKAFAEPLRYMKEYFEAFRESKDYRLTHNSQVCYLKAVLNDKFDPLLRGIDIENCEVDDDGINIYERSEDSPLIIHKREDELPVTIFRRNFGGSRSTNFEVKLPLRLKDRVSEYEVSATVNEYKLASMKYKLTYFSNLWTE